MASTEASIPVVAERSKKEKKEKKPQKPKQEQAKKAAPVDTKGITIKKSEDLAEWYQQILSKGEKDPYDQLESY